MSGIAAIYNLDGRPVDSALLARMLTAAAHRGPGGTNGWVDGSIALGHAMLHATLESLQERQPLRDECLDLCLTFDGRVDNRRDLAGAIESCGVALRSDTDAEMVLRAYQCWGEDSVRHIIGDFAFAVWDGRRQQLFCARDPLGVKPFHYYCDGRAFVCGSEPQQILEDPRVPREPNEGMVAESLTGGAVSCEETLFRGVMRLAPGSTLVVRDGQVKTRIYFEPDPDREIRYRNEEDYAARFFELLKEAVRCRMRAVGGVAAELSGGLDSSSIVGIVAALRQEGVQRDLPFEIFSMTFSDPAADERPYIREVLEMHDFRHNSVEGGLSSFESCREQARLYKCPPHYPTFEMSEPLRCEASAKGLRVAITGQGGDDWVSGSALQFVDLIRSFRLAEAFRRLRTDVRLAQLDPAMSESALTLLLKYRIWPAVPERVRRIVRKAVGRDTLPPWLNRDLVFRTHLKERLQRRPDRRRYSSPVRQESYDSFRHGWLTYCLETLDRAWARHGVEVRHPFHDLRLIEFLISIPEDQRRRGDEIKFVLRRAMRGLAPRVVLARREKADFTAISVQAFQNTGGERLFDRLAVASAGWVDAERARAAYQEMMDLYVRGDINYAARMWPLFSLFAVDLWLKEAILNRQDEDVTFRLARQSVSA